MELRTLSMKNLPRVLIFTRGPFGPLGENGLLLVSLGMNFFLLTCGKIIYAQVTHAEIAFIYNFPGIYISGNINKFGNFPRAENAFLDHPVWKTFSRKCFLDHPVWKTFFGKCFLDWAWINGFGKCFADQSGNNISEIFTCTKSADFRKQYFRKSLPEYIENFPNFFGIFEK